MDELRKKIWKSLVPLEYPSTSIASPSTVGYAYLTAEKDLPEFDPNIHNAVMFDQLVRPRTVYAETASYIQYSIPQIGEFCLQFRLSSHARSVTFTINGVTVSEREDVHGETWYNLFDCPVNLFAAPYGQRFLIVDYSADGNRDVIFRYLSTDEKTRQNAIDVAAGLWIK